MKKDAPRVFKGNRPLSESRINRAGLKRGSIAPAFTLPLCGGGEISLEKYRGKKLLLVFSAPDCPPCREMMPQLEALHRQTPDIEVMLISRGKIDAVKAELAEHPVSFPVAVQKSWEISRRYAMFATPIAYLIDEAGKTASEVTTGPEPILMLLASAQMLALSKTMKLLKDSMNRKIKAIRTAERKRS